MTDGLTFKCDTLPRVDSLDAYPVGGKRFCIRTTRADNIMPENNKATSCHLSPEDALKLACALMDWARDHIEVTVSGPGWEITDPMDYDYPWDDEPAPRATGTLCTEDPNDYFFGEGPDGAGREEWR